MTSGSKIVPNDSHELDLVASQRGILNELERHGYLVERQSAAAAGGTICRHPGAPDLLVRDDGRIELLSGQAYAHRPLRRQEPAKRIHWGRGLLFVALLGVIAFVGLLIFGMIAG